MGPTGASGVESSENFLAIRLGKSHQVLLPRRQTTKGGSLLASDASIGSLLRQSKFWTCGSGFLTISGGVTDQPQHVRTHCGWRFAHLRAPDARCN